MTQAIRIGQGKQTRGTRRDGFLLVEVLATMTISAFLLAALFSIATMTTRTAARVDRQSLKIENTSRIMAALTREIEQIAPIRWPGRGAGFVFSGTETNLAFARENASAGGGIDIGAVTLDAGRTGLTRRMASISPVAASFADIATGPSEAVFGDQYAVRFAYYARLANGQEALVNAWQDPAQLPVAVRITLKDRNGTGIASRIKLLVDTESGCAFPQKALCSLMPTGKNGNDPNPDARGKIDTTPVASKKDGG